MAKIRAETRAREMCGLLVMLKLANFVQKILGGHGRVPLCICLTQAVFLAAHEHP